VLGTEAEQHLSLEIRHDHRPGGVERRGQFLALVFDMEGMGMYYSGWVAQSKAKSESAADTPHFLAFKSLEPFIDKHLGDLQYTRRGRSIE
jgi:hypothetical protein